MRREPETESSRIAGGGGGGGRGMKGEEEDSFAKTEPPPVLSLPNFILSSELVQPSWHVFVEMLVIKFSMLIR